MKRNVNGVGRGALSWHRTSSFFSFFPPFFFFFFFWRDFSRSKDRRQRLPFSSGGAHTVCRPNFIGGRVRTYVSIKGKYRTPDRERGNVRVALPTQAEIKYLKHAPLADFVRSPVSPPLASISFFDPLLHLRRCFFLPFVSFFSPSLFSFFFIPRLLIRRYEIGRWYVSTEGTLAE